MSEEVLRNREGRVLGRTKTLSDGKIEIRDRAGYLKGSYNPKTNETRDRSGRVIGRGNLLTNLLIH